MTFDDYDKIFKRHGFEDWEVRMHPEMEYMLVVKTVTFSQALMDEINSIVDAPFTASRWEKLK